MRRRKNLIFEDLVSVSDSRKQAYECKRVKNKSLSYVKFVIQEKMRLQPWQGFAGCGVVGEMSKQGSANRVDGWICQTLFASIIIHSTQLLNSLCFVHSLCLAHPTFASSPIRILFSCWIDFRLFNIRKPV
jgi:hypothetical protein